MSINQVVLAGNIVYPPDFKTSKAGNPFCRFTICVDKYIYDKEKQESINHPNFFNCVLFGRRAESLRPRLQKGQKIALSGELQSSRYTDDEGNKTTSVSIIVDKLEFLSKAPAEPAQAREHDHFEDIFNDLVDAMQGAQDNPAINADLGI